MPSYVQFPNALTYTFQFDSCGHLTKVTYPSGGYTRYQYSNPYTFGNWTYNGSWQREPLSQVEVMAKYVCASPAVAPGATSAAAGNTWPNTAEESTAYTPVFNTGDTNNEQETVVDAVGNQTVVTYSQTTPSTPREALHK